MKTQPGISLQLLTETQYIYASKTTQRILEIHLAAPPRDAAGKRLPLNIALVLDRSGSMQGEKLACVKQAAMHVLDLLGESDRAAVVTYDDQVSVIAESTPLTPAARDQMKRLIHKVKSGGTTNLSEGWLTGCQRVAQHQAGEGGQVDRALLLTDGLANAGITDVEELAVHARELAERGVSTSTFGVGEGFNEQLLEVMATNGGGNFYYIVSPLDIPGIFAREFHEMMDITASDVEITLTLASQVCVTVLGTWRAEAAGNGGQRIALGSLGGSQEKNLYCDLQFPPGSEGQQVTLGVTVRGRHESGSILESQAQVAFTYASEEKVQSAGADAALLERAALARVSDAARKSLEMERKGQAAPAASMLRDAIRTNEGHLDPASRNTYAQMAQRIQDGMDEPLRKQAHYQSYLHRSQRSDALFEAHLQPGEDRQAGLLRQLLVGGAARLRPGGWLWQAPAPLPPTFRFDRAEGMLLGLAIGDALGSTTAGMLPAERRAAAGEVRDYLPNRFAGGQPAGVPGSVTQLAFWTLEALLQEGRLDPDRLARRFTQEKIFGITSTVKEFIRAYKDLGRTWTQAGQESAGSGAVVRIAPVLLPHLRRPSAGLWADAVLAGMLTHNDYASNAACAAWAGTLWELLGMRAAPPPEWWGESFHRLAAPLEGGTRYGSRMPGLSYRGTVADFVKTSLERALSQNWTALQAGDTWGSGAYLLETLPTALYILARHAGDPEQALLRAVNDTKDSDGIAALVGAAVGALHGKDALPRRWVAGLLGRTGDHNDGHVFRLIDEARVRFG